MILELFCNERLDRTSKYEYNISLDMNVNGLAAEFV